MYSRVSDLPGVVLITYQTLIIAYEEQTQMMEVFSVY